MARYIEFKGADGKPILVEVEESEVVPKAGVVKVGLKDKAQEVGSAVVSIAQTTFEEALEGVLRPNAAAFIRSIRSIPEPPTEVEITFGLKVTGEIGNVAICKVGGEANYSVKLSWKSDSAKKS